MTRIVCWLIARRVGILFFALMVGAVAGARMAATYAALRSDLEELLPTNAPSVQALSSLRSRLAGIKYLGVVVDTGGRQNVPQASRFLEQLAGRIREYPPNLVTAVRTGVSAEREFAETYALQLMEPADVRTLRESIERRRDWEVGRALDINLLDEEEEGPPPVPVEELRKKYKDRYGTNRSFPNDRFISQDGKTAVLLVQMATTEAGTSTDQELLDRVRTDVATLGFPDAYAPGMRVGYAGEVATRVEELRGLEVDLATSAGFVIALEIAVFLWFFRSLRSLPILGLPLFLGTALAFALVALPPFSIRHLNSNTAFLGSIVAGNGINPGVILLARFLEERRAGRKLDAAIVDAVEDTWKPTLAASLAAAAAYGSLTITEFRGFNQFGWIGSIGMLTCWLSTYTLGPVLTHILGRKIAVREEHSAGPIQTIVLRMLRHPRPVLCAVAAVAVVGAVGIWHRSGTWMEWDFSRLRRADSLEHGERYWGARMNDTLGRYLTPTIVMADNEERAVVIEERIRELKRDGKAGGLIGEVRSIRDILPAHRSQSLDEVKKIREALTPRMKSTLSPEERRITERATSEASLHLLMPSDLPDVLTAGLRELDGRVDRTVLIFPKLESGTWDGSRMSAFTADVRQAATVDDRRDAVSGALLLSTDITYAMRKDGPKATFVALSFVIVVCLLAFRGHFPAPATSTVPTFFRGPIGLSSLSIGSLFLGLLYMMGIMAWAGQRLNFSNFVTLPITFGIGADYSINMLRRWQSDGYAELRGAVASTGGAVAVCSATTVIGFGSLLAAQNGGLRSFGMFAVAGELSCSLAAVVALPSLLCLLMGKPRGLHGITGELPTSHHGNGETPR